MSETNGTRSVGEHGALRRLVAEFLRSERFQALSGLARAVYLLLLVHDWTSGGRGLPVEDDDLCALLGLEEPDWDRIRDEVLPLFEIEPGTKDGEVVLRPAALAGGLRTRARRSGGR